MARTPRIIPTTTTPATLNANGEPEPIRSISPQADGVELTPEEIDGPVDELAYLNFLADTPNVVLHVYRLSEDDDNRRPPRGAFVCKLKSSEDLEDEIKRRAGGGVYRVVARRGARIVKSIVLEIEGLPITTAPPPSEDGAAITQTLEQLTRELRELRESRGAPKSESVTLLEAVRLVNELRPSEPATPLAPMLEVLKQGIELGSSRTRPDGVDWVGVIDKVGPHLSDVARVFVDARRPRSAPVTATAAAAPAQIPAAATNTDRDRRFLTVIEKFARELERGALADADDVAHTAELVLHDDELERLSANSVDQVLTFLAPASERYPALKGEHTRGLVERVLAQLNAQDGADE